MQATSFLLDGGPSRSIRIVFNEANLIHTTDPDTTFLKSIVHHSGDEFRPLHQLSPLFKNALLAIAGPCGKEKLGFNNFAASCSVKLANLKLAHLSNPITFILTHVPNFRQTRSV